MTQAQPSAKDVTGYILQKYGPMTHMKLQKLLYYSQAWSLVWDERPIFGDPIQAWVNGPVVRSVYAELRQSFNVSSDDLSTGPDLLDKSAKETVDVVLEFYGQRSAQYLSDLTHMEDPWNEARKGLSPNERSEREITHASMAEYYSGLQA